MRKTTIYLPDDEADLLRRKAEETGKSQAELVREGIRHVLADVPPRRFHSMGSGRGTGEPYAPWDVDDLARESLGEPRNRS